MKRVLCLLAVFVFCLSLACPVLAADTFVPSITEKDHPEIEWPVMLTDGDGEIIEEIDEGCLVITPVSEAETSEEIPEESKELLLEVYEGLSDGSMTLPHEDELVIRDLFDASLICTDDHAEKLKEEGVCIEITLKTGIAAGEDVIVMAYVDGQWVSAVKVVNNGDGTITVLLEDICPIAIAVREGYYDVPSQTGDTSGIVIWTAVMLIAAAALVVLLAVRRKAVR